MRQRAELSQTSCAACLKIQGLANLSLVHRWRHFPRSSQFWLVLRAVIQRRRFATKLWGLEFPHLLERWRSQSLNRDFRGQCHNCQQNFRQCWEVCKTSKCVMQTYRTTWHLYYRSSVKPECMVPYHMIYHPRTAVPVRINHKTYTCHTIHMQIYKKVFVLFQVGIQTAAYFWGFAFSMIISYSTVRYECRRKRVTH